MKMTNVGLGLATICALLMAPIMNRAVAGDKTGGGGDDVALEFQEAFTRVLSKTKKHNTELYEIILREKLSSISEKAQVIIIDKDIPVEVQGLIQNSIAYNDPKVNRILINRERWNRIQKEEIKEAISLHEIASLAGLESSGNYPLSTRYLQTVGGDRNELIAQLTVDRVKQMIAESPEASKSSIIYQLFRQSQDATVSDVPFLSKAKHSWGGCALFDPRLPNEPIPYIVAKYHGRLSIEKQDLRSGPLFSSEESSERVLVIEALLASYVEQTVATEDDFYPNITFLKGSGVTTKERARGYASSFTSTSLSKGFTSHLQLKKDQKYLYFSLTSVLKGQAGVPIKAYGYCWPKE